MGHASASLITNQKGIMHAFIKDSCNDNNKLIVTSHARPRRCPPDENNKVIVGPPHLLFIYFVCLYAEGMIGIK